MAHLDLDRKCMVCEADGQQRHKIQNAFKLACMRWTSGPVRHDGKVYSRMKLIKAQEDSLRQHRLQIGAIVDAQRNYERVRDISRAEVAKRYSIRMQDFGIDIEQDDPVDIGKKVI